jgi:hypothetical protein
VLERLGLRYTHHELYPPTGRQHPSYLLTRDEYQARSQSPPSPSGRGSG